MVLECGQCGGVVTGSCGSVCVCSAKSCEGCEERGSGMYVEGG